MSAVKASLMKFGFSMLFYELKKMFDVSEDQELNMKGLCLGAAGSLPSQAIPWSLLIATHRYA